MVEVLYVTYVQNGETIIEKTLDDVVLDDKTVIVHLTQADTLKFVAGDDNKVEMQIRARLSDGSTPQTNIIKTNVGRILKDGEI